jgi:hypothetical protein
MKRTLAVMTAALAVTFLAQAQFLGSKNSNKFHRQECQWAKRISPSNLLKFTSAEEASRKGYQPCKVCSPVTTGSDKIAPFSGNKLQKNLSTDGGDGRCEAVTKKGTRCSRAVKPGSRYCWQHQK